MSIDISPENERFIQNQIASGAYQNRSDAIDAGIELLRRRDELLHRIDRGRRQLNEGDCRDYDDQSLAERFNQLKQRAQGVADDRHES